VLPKKFPFNKSCCNRYPTPSLSHLVLLAMVLLVGPYLTCKALKPGKYIQSPLP
jgi:hypothetical protein